MQLLSSSSRLIASVSRGAIFMENWCVSRHKANIILFLSSLTEYRMILLSPDRISNFFRSKLSLPMLGQLNVVAVLLSSAIRIPLA